MVKNPSTNAGDLGLIPVSERYPEERNGNPLLGVRSLAGYSPWGCKELDMTEGLTHEHIPFVKADPEKSFIENPDSRE